MPARKMRVDIYDEAGNRYTITFQGRVTRDRALRIFDMIELLGGMPSVAPERERKDQLSKIKKVQYLIQRHFPIVWFNAKEVQSIYETDLNEPINLSTVSTYLSRLADRGILLRNRSSNRVQYRFVSESFQKMLNVVNLT